MSDFGYQEKSIYDEGGWMYEEGEERYYEALKKWNKSKAMTKGTFVNYVDSFTKEKELGRVLRADDGSGTVGVVFNCGGNWDDYENYTAQRVKIEDLLS